MCVYRDLKKSIRSSQKWTILTEKKFFRRIEISSPADDTVSRKVIKKVRVGPSATTVTSVSAGGGDKWNTERAMGSKLWPRPRRITVEQLDSQCSAPRESHFSPFLGKQRSSPFVPPYERIVGKGTGGEARRAIETTKKSRFRKLVKRYKGKKGGVLSRRHFLSRVAQWRGKVVTFFLSSSFSLSLRVFPSSILSPLSLFLVTNTNIFYKNVGHLWRVDSYTHISDDVFITYIWMLNIC